MTLTTKIGARLFACLVSLPVVAGIGGNGFAFAQSVSAKKGEAKFDACRLIQKKEVEAVQRSPIKETKSSEQSEGALRVSQCFYTAEEFSRSVTLAVFQRHSNEQSSKRPREFWKETFGRDRGNARDEKETAKSGEKEDEGSPPKKIDRLGDDAYWVRNRFGGNLYVLKGDTFISISIGGSDAEEVKLDKSKKLAAKALRRL